MEFIVECFGLHGYKENERAPVEKLFRVSFVCETLKGRKHCPWNAVYVFSSNRFATIV